MYRKYISIFLALLALLPAACAYLTEDSIQNVTFETPGVVDSRCFVYVDGFRYRVHPPQTISLSKSKNDMKVDCLAPGNRRKEIYIESVMTKRVAGNAATGLIPGTAWDFASGALFKYPDIVRVDFSDTPARDEELPSYHAPELRPPEDHMMEEIRPGVPRLNEDRYAPPTEWKKRSTARPPTVPQNMIEEGQGSDKGDLKRVLNSLKSDMDPAAAPSKPPAPVPEKIGPPVPLYPGQ